MADLTQVQLPNGTTYDLKDNTKVAKAGDTMTGALNLAGSDLSLNTSGSSSDDSGDIVWKYGNGQEKARLWTNNEYSSAVGLNYRVYKKDGTNVYDGTIPLTDTNTTYTLSTSGNNVVLTPSSGSANTITVPYATNAGKVNNLTVQTAVPANAVFTDNAVTQTDLSAVDSEYRLLISKSANDTTETASVYKTPDLLFNPSDHRLTLGVNGAGGSTAGALRLNNSSFSIYDSSGNRRAFMPYWGDLWLYNSSGSTAIMLTSSDGNIRATSLNGVTIGSSPKFTDTTYSAGTGISLSGTTINAKIWEGTQAQYDAIASKDPQTTYYITDGAPVGTSIDDIDDVTITNPQTDNQLYYSNGVWYNADAKVKQAEVTTNAYYKVLFSGVDSDSTITATSGKSDQLLFNPYTSRFSIGQINLPHTYSATEQIVGYWIDGKPIYEQTLTLSNVTVPANGNYTYDTTSLGIDQPIKAEACINFNGDKRVVPFNQNQAYYFRLTNFSTTQLVFSRGSGALTCTIYATLQYTKV